MDHPEGTGLRQLMGCPLVMQSQAIHDRNVNAQAAKETHVKRFKTGTLTMPWNRTAAIDLLDEPFSKMQQAKVYRSGHIELRQFNR